MTRRAAARVVRVLFAVLGVAFMAVAFERTWDGSVAELAIAWWRFPLAGALAVAGLVCAFEGWAVLVGGDQRRALASGFYLSQLGKYIPGGIWQALSQIGYTTRARVSVPRATTAFAVFAVTQSAAGGLIGGLLAVAEPAANDLIRLAAVAAAGLVVLLYRRWMVTAVALVRRLQRREDADALVPGQRMIVRSFLWSVGTMTAHGAMFAVLLDGLAPQTRPLTALSVSALAWTVGFLALPVPSGIGVREAVMIAVLGPTAGAPIAIVASVYQRLATIVGEALMILVARWRLGRAPLATEPEQLP